MISRFKYTPIALFGCPLGFMGLTLATMQIETDAGVSHLAGGILLAITLILFMLVLGAYLVKVIRFPADARADWLHPVRANFFAIVSGTLALLGLALLPFARDAALLVWVAGAVSHLLVTLAIASKWIGPGVTELATLTPALFLPAVGNVLVPLAGVPLGYIEVSWFFFSVGLVLWLTLLPILIGRLITQPSPPDGLLPTLVILIAPPALLMINTVRLTPDSDLILARILYYASFMLFLFVLTQTPRLVRIKFTLSWWAYTFPVAAFTIGTLTFAQASGYVGFKYFGTLLFTALIVIVLMVLWKTLSALVAGQLFAPEG